MNRLLYLFILLVFGVDGRHSAVGQEWDQIYKSAADGVVYIEIEVVTSDRRVELLGWGTGFIVSSGRDYVLTNKHVARPGDLPAGATVRLTGYVRNAEGQARRLLEAEVHVDDDLALLKFANPPDAPAKQLMLDPNWQESVGAKVVTIGFPGVDKDAALQSRPAPGIITNVNARFENRLVVEADISGRRGNSGGPVLNENGDVVGILSSRLKLDQRGEPIHNVTYYIPFRKSCGLLAAVSLSCEGNRIESGRRESASPCSVPLPVRQVSSLSEFYDKEEYGTIAYEEGDSYRVIDENECYTSSDIPNNLTFFFNNAVSAESSFMPNYLGIVVVKTYPTEWEAGKKFYVSLYRNPSDPHRPDVWGVPTLGSDLEMLRRDEAVGVERVRLLRHAYRPEVPATVDDPAKLPETVIRVDNTYSRDWIALLLAPDELAPDVYTVLGNPYQVRRSFGIDHKKMALDEAATVAIRYYLIKFQDSQSPNKEVKFTIHNVRAAQCVYIKVFQPGEPAPLLNHGRFPSNMVTLQLNDEFTCLAG